MDESIEALMTPIIFLVLAGIFYLVIELRIKMLKCRE